MKMYRTVLEQIPVTEDVTHWGERRQPKCIFCGRKASYGMSNYASCNCEGSKKYEELDDRRAELEREAEMAMYEVRNFVRENTCREVEEMRLLKNIYEGGRKIGIPIEGLADALRILKIARMELQLKKGDGE
jgi:hypothetical protein